MINYLSRIVVIQKNALVVLLFLFVGCSGPKEKTPNASQSKTIQQVQPEFPSAKTDNVFVYGCGDSLQFTAYVAQDSTWLFLQDTTLKVMRVRSGSGAKYQRDEYIYWSKEDEALLQKPQGSLMNCKSIPQERSWAAAKIRGVDFRALGQEPGWHLEVTEGKQIQYIGNYGRDTILTPTPKPEIADSQRTVYKTEKLAVEITKEPCSDSMSGFNFPATVSVTVDGKTYRGCGRSLN